MPVTFNATYLTPQTVFRATSGGTVFSANLAGTAAHDLFDDSPAANDAIYFCGFSGSNFVQPSDLKLNIGTALAGTDVVLAWEYYGYNYPTGPTWRPIPAANLNDESAGFTLTGVRTVKFPLQLGHWYGVVNGVNGCWVRCRLVSFTAVTEGGANATSAMQVGDGFVDVTGYTTASPCTFAIVYDWLTANRPDVGAVHVGQCGSLVAAPGRLFIFERCGFRINSPLQSNQESIFLGTGGRGPYQQLNYLQMGTKAGDGYTRPSNLFVSQYNTGQGFGQIGANAKLYGGVIGVWGYTQSGNMGIGSGADIVGTVFACMTTVGLPFAGTNVRLGGGQFTIPALNKVDMFHGGFYFATLQAFVARPEYDTRELRECRYAQPVPTNVTTNWGFINLQNWGNRDYFRLIDCSPVLGDQTAHTNAAVGRPVAADANLTTILTWDASANTFTTHTTNIPLHGDVGDCIYLRPAGTTSYRDVPCYLFTMPGGHANDYEYIWEYWGGGAWRTLYMFDGTYQLSQTGRVWGRYPYAESNSIVNGVTAVWQRIRIVAKGTETPIASTVTCSLQGGVGVTAQSYGGAPVDWRFSEEFTAAVAVTDEAGDPIAGATIVVTDKNGDALAGSPFTSDADGLATVETVRRRYFFDPLDESGNGGWADIGYTEYNPYTFTVSKAGYESYVTELTLEEKTAMPLTLKRALPVMLSNRGPALRLNPANLGADRELLLLP